jgi:hypothetical protein
MSCSRRVFPEKVVKAVREELEKEGDDDDSNGDGVPLSMRLSTTIKAAKLQDSTVSNRRDETRKQCGLCILTGYVFFLSSFR